MEEISRYEKYKDSGIEWIGEIPENWDIKKIKHRCYVKGRVGWKGLKSSEFLTDGFSYLVTGTDFKNDTVDWDNCYHIDEERYNEDPYIQLQNEDLLITKDGTIGKLAVVTNLDKPACLNSGIFVVRSTKEDFSTRYLLWVLKSSTFTDFNGLTAYGSTIQHLYQNVFVEFAFAFPPVQTQISIADYLRKKTAEIDQIIANKQKLITFYEEEKQAIINQAVTASIQENVIYKKTSTDWLDEIPYSWQFLAMKRLVSTKITDGPHETPEFFPDGVPFLSAESVKNGKLDFDFRRGNISKELDEIYSKKCKPKRDDIFIVKSGSTTGKIAIVDFDDDFNIWSPLALIRVNEKVKPYFLYYALQSFYFQKQIQLSWSFGTQPNIGMNVIENLKVAVPISLEEQESIISHIEAELKRLNEIIVKFNKQIDLLQEYRTTLISEVVTGKIKVPNTIEA